MKAVTYWLNEANKLKSIFKHKLQNIKKKFTL